MAQESGTSSYTMGYTEEFLQLLGRRSAKTHASYLLPHLEPGMRVLDFGCGPGTISVGLAMAVDPGELHGIDMEESQIGLARAAAEAGGHANATFHVGDVTDLPFEDGYFDVAHCHAVLMHVPDTKAVLSEVKRVLKPGGIVASRELFVSSSFLEPDEEDIESAWDTFAKLLAGNGGHPQMGKELRKTFLEAGFSEVRAGGSFDFFSYARGRRLPSWLHTRLVLLARRHRGGHEIRAGDPGAVRRVAPRPGRMEESPRGMWSVRLRRGRRP